MNEDDFIDAVAPASENYVGTPLFITWKMSQADYGTIAQNQKGTVCNIIPDSVNRLPLKAHVRRFPGGTLATRGIVAGDDEQ